MMEKSAAWEAGFIAGVENMDEMEKEAFLRNLAGGARRTLGRAGMGVAGGLERATGAVGKRLGGTRLGGLADRAAMSAGASARTSARAVDTSNIAQAARSRAKASQGRFQQRVRQATTPEARQALVSRRQAAQQRLARMKGPNATKAPAAAPAATPQSALGSFVSRHKRPLLAGGAGLAAGAAGTYAITRPGQGQQA